MADAPPLPGGAGLSREQAVGFYRDMLRIRRFELTVARLSRAGEVPGFVHLSTGAEASAVGVISALRPEDVVFSSHRAHGHILARGSDPARVLAEITGRAGGLCAGRGGSMHLVDTSVGFLGATGVVGGTLPLALGAAEGVRAHGALAAVFFGDGASTTGVFHECLNLASLWSLPVLFCCENNGYAEFTARSEQSRVPEAHAFARVYGIESACIDASDVESVWSAAVSAARRVREGAPHFLEMRVVRLSGHYEGDPQAYRSREERQAAEAGDPVARQRRRLLDHWRATEEELAELEDRVRAEVEAAERAAQAGPLPDPAGLGVV